MTMLKIIVSQWAKNKENLRKILSERTDMNEVEYKDLVKLTFETIYNNNLNLYKDKLDLEKITEIDNGNYQGTLLFLIPFDTYQPSEFEYLMTFVGYGSCSSCDTLQSIQHGDHEKLTEMQVSDFMTLCKDILTNTIRPYNGGWREQEDFNQAEEEI
jgi:hypothetical protein